MPHRVLPTPTVLDQCTVLLPKGSTTFLQPARKGITIPRPRDAALLLDRLLDGATAQGRWMWKDLAGQTPWAALRKVLDTSGHYTWMHTLPIEGATTPAWAIMTQDGSGILGRRDNGGTLIAPFLLTIVQGPPTLTIKAGGPPLERLAVRWVDGRAQRRVLLLGHAPYTGDAANPAPGTEPWNLDAPHTPPAPGDPTPGWIAAAAGRLRADVDTLARVFDDATGDARFPHLHDGAYGPSAWVPSAPHPADPGIAAEVDSALRHATAWLWGAFEIWGIPAEQIHLERLGYRTGLFLLTWRSAGPRHTTHKARLTVDHLARIWPESLAQRLHHALHAPLGLRYWNPHDIGQAKGRDGHHAHCSLLAPPTRHAVLGVLAEGLPTAAQHAALERAEATTHPKIP